MEFVIIDTCNACIFILDTYCNTTLATVDLTSVKYNNDKYSAHSFTLVHCSVFVRFFL